MRWSMRSVLTLDELICNVLLVNIVVLLSLTVTLRYVFYTAYPAADELVGFSFVWFVYLSMVVATRKSRHFRVELVLTSVPQRLRGVLELLADSFWFAFNVVVVVQGLAIIASMHRFKNRSPMLGWSMEYLYVIIPLSFALVSVHIVLNWVRGWRSRRGGGALQQ